MPRQKLTQRSDGYFKCKYHGQQFYGKTQSEAFKRRDEYIAAERIGLNHDMDKVTFREYAMNWLAVYHSDSRLPVQNQYAGMINYAADHLKKQLLQNITTDDMQRLCNTLSSYSLSYVSKFTGMLKAIFKTAVANGATVRNPMDAVKRIKTKKVEGHRALEPWERELVASTYTEHDFGLVAMTMMYAGLRRGEALFIDVDRDVDFNKKIIHVRGAVSFADGNQAVETAGKTAAALRTVPLVPPLEKALRGHHGLLCTKKGGGLMSQCSFTRKYDSYITFLETKLNGCHKRWYGKTNEHKALLAEGKELPAWRDVNIRCHDFRVDFCTRNFYAHIPIKTLQAWMGHEEADMILSVYTKLTDEQERADALLLASYMEKDLNPV